MIDSKKFVIPRYALLRKENFKLLIQSIFGLFCIFLAWWFFHHEKNELRQVPSILAQAHLGWLLAGGILVIAYIVLQAFMYNSSFKAVGAKVHLRDTIPLFLKRNFISVFLPAGGVSALAFYNKSIEKRGIARTKIHIASAIYGFVGILSVIMVAIPAFILAMFFISVDWTAWLGLGLVCVLTGGLFWFYQTIKKGGGAKRWLSQKIPVLQVILNELHTGNLQMRGLTLTVLWSVLIEFCGIAHLYIALGALGIAPGLLSVTMGYIVAVIFMMISPFLRGLGAVELSMAYLLINFGLSQEVALTGTLLFRIFEFWLPLALGLLTFVIKWNKIIIRIFPAVLLITLGGVNILSVLTPEIAARLHMLRAFVPLEVMQASNYFVFAAGVYMIIAGIFLFKGLRNAWIFAIILTLFSIAGNLLKGYDYEEATFSAVVLLLLWLTRKQYIAKSSSKWGVGGIFIALIGIGLALLYSIVGFYFLNKVHFHLDFSLGQSITYSLKSFFLLDTGLQYQDAFGKTFLASVHLLGGTCLAFLIYSIIRPLVWDSAKDSLSKLELAKELTQKYGNSSLDYFKYYPDKQIFFTGDRLTFLAFKVAGRFAVVLEKPVSHTKKAARGCIEDFENFCEDSGLSPIYYRVAEKDLPLFKKATKKRFYLGQEAVVGLDQFTLTGKDKKSMRNALNKIRSSGFVTRIYEPPIALSLLERLGKVSAEWLAENKMEEMAFSQGAFTYETVQNNTIFTLEDAASGDIVAFLNVIPDYAPGEGTYDLIRKSEKAPNGSMDALILDMFDYFRKLGLRYANLGMAPMSGVKQPNTAGERAIKLAYENIRAFAHYKGLREYKEKFEPEWSNMYMLYEDDYQLLSIPRILKKVMKL